MKKGNPIALLPIGVFLVLYLGLGLLFEYGLHIPMGFYNIPIVIAFLVAILVACLQNRAVPFEEKLVIMGQGVGDMKQCCSCGYGWKNKDCCRSCSRQIRLYSYKNGDCKPKLC